MSPADQHVAYIALGANLGDRRTNIEAAIAALRDNRDVEVVAVSRFLETEPVGPSGQGPYLNAAAQLLTTLAPRDLLNTLLAIEQSRGRDRRTQARWGPRTLDIDLLLYDDLVIDEPGLTIPHPRMHERTFVLLPLLEIAGCLVHPTLGIPLQSLLDGLEREPITEYRPSNSCS